MDLLQRFGGGNRAAKRYYRVTLGVGSGQARRQIGDAGPRGCDGDTRLTRHPANAAGIEDVASVLKDAGARLVDVALPGPPLIFRQVTTLISGSERASAHERDFIAHGNKMGRELRDSLMAGLAARSVDYLAAQRRRRELAAAIDAAVTGVDAVLLPGTLHTAPPASDADKVKAFMSDAMTTAFNISGHPALVLRTGFDHDGLPTNAQIVGRYFDEATVLRVAHTYERAREWHKRRPPL